MVCVCVWGGVNYVYVCVYVCVMVCASALSFLDRKICIIQEPSIIIIIIITMSHRKMHALEPIYILWALNMENCTKCFGEEQGTYNILQACTTACISHT